jgi:hypothetical protein
MTPAIEKLKKHTAEINQQYLEDVEFEVGNFKICIFEHLIAIKHKTTFKYVHVGKYSISLEYFTAEELDNLTYEFEQIMPQVLQKQIELNQLYCEHPYEKVKENTCTICGKHLTNI